MLALHRRALGRLLGTALGVAASGSTFLQAERLPFQIYNASQALAHNRIRCVLANSRRFLWFCTPTASAGSMAAGLSTTDWNRVFRIRR